jgi:hypothetical protein
VKAHLTAYPAGLTPPGASDLIVTDIRGEDMFFRHLGIGVAAAMIAAVPNAALAQARADSGITYDCDTAANHYSELVLPAGAAPFTVTGKVKLLSVVASKEYVPIARLSISNASGQPGPADEGWAGFECMVAPAAKGKTPTISALAFSRREVGKENDVDIAGAPSGEDVPFTLAYDGARVSVNVDGHTKQFEFVSSKPVVRIVCSTGEFLYSDILIRPRR